MCRLSDDLAPFQKHDEETYRASTLLTVQSEQAYTCLEILQRLLQERMQSHLKTCALAPANLQNFILSPQNAAIVAEM